MAQTAPGVTRRAERRAARWASVRVSPAENGMSATRTPDAMWVGGRALRTRGEQYHQTKHSGIQFLHHFGVCSCGTGGGEEQEMPQYRSLDRKEGIQGWVPVVPYASW